MCAAMGELVKANLWASISSAADDPVSAAALSVGISIIGSAISTQMSRGFQPLLLPIMGTFSFALVCASTNVLS